MADKSDAVLPDATLVVEDKATTKSRVRRALGFWLLRRAAGVLGCTVAVVGEAAHEEPIVVVGRPPHPNFGPAAGICSYCGGKIQAYESKCVHRITGKYCCVRGIPHCASRIPFDDRKNWDYYTDG